MFRRVTVLIFPIVVAMFGVWGVVSAETDPKSPDAGCRLATRVVSNTDDDGVGSLRFEILVLQDCLSGGTVEFAPEIAGQTITLTSEIEISEEIVISAENRDITIAGENSTSLFVVAATGDLALSHLTISEGRFAVVNNGLLQVDQVSFISNTNSTLTNSNIANVTNSRFVSNDTGPGGDGTLRNSGTLTVTNTLFKDNNSRRGAGVFNNTDSTAVVINSTFTGAFSTYGTTSGGGLHNQGVMTATHNTFVANRTGFGTIHGQGGTLTLINNVMVDNTSQCRFTNGGVLAVSRGNWVDGNGCSESFTGDAQLAALADNGGPTETFAVLVGSGLNQAVSADCTPTDARGEPRGTTCDIGAFESNSLPTAVGLVQFDAGSRTTAVLTLFLTMLLTMGSVVLWRTK